MKKSEQQEGAAQHELILNEATGRGIKIEDRSNEYECLAALLKLEDQEELIVSGIPQSWLTIESQKVCDGKNLCKEMFAELEIPSPRAYVFTSAVDVMGILDGKSAYVCKPVYGTNGRGVELGIFTMDDMLFYFSKHHVRPPFLLERQLKGDDLRIQIIGGKIVAACVRKPAFVIGDGSQTLKELITEREEEIQLQNPANRLRIDRQTNDLIRAQSLTLDHIIPTGKKVQLKQISNMGQGGIAIDVTEEIDRSLEEWIKKICDRLGVSYFALDIIAEDISDIKSYSALELNARAEWMHHTFSEVKTHDLAKVVLDELFA